MASNTDKTFHQRMKIEKLISEAKYTDALSVGKRNAETDSSTTMLRAYALSRTGLMGEKLFEYSLIGGSDAMLPNGKSEITYCIIILMSIIIVTIITESLPETMTII
jgi:hypothetical protein